MTKFPRRQFLRLAAGAAALPVTSRIARAQAYPARPITIVVGFAAGGPTDTGARILADRLKPLLPPGRLKLATSPVWTGSSPEMKTIGIVLVAAIAVCVIAALEPTRHGQSPAALKAHSIY